MFLMGIRSMCYSYVCLGLYTTLYFQAFVSHYGGNKEKLDAAHLGKAAQIVCNIMHIIHIKATRYISSIFACFLVTTKPADLVAVVYELVD